MSIAPHTRALIKTDITFIPPEGTYGQITSRSGLAVKYQTDAKAGVIDNDYRGNVSVLLANSSDEPLPVATGDRIAQLILYRISSPTVEQIQAMDETERGESGFGSTGIAEAIVRTINGNSDTPAPHNVLDQSHMPSLTPDVHGYADIVIQNDGIKPFNIWMSNDPFDNRLPIMIDVKGNHPTLGLQLHNIKDNRRVQLTGMQTSTPAAKIPKWRSTLRWSYLLSIDDTPITSTAAAEQAIALARKNKQFKVKCVFATEKKYGTHPIEGSLNIYFDQINSFSKHIHEADQEYFKTRDQQASKAWHEYVEDDGDSTNLDAIIRTVNQAKPTSDMTDQRLYDPADDPELGKFFKKKEIKSRPDYEEWRQSCFKQLDQYNTQGMFSDPMELKRGDGASYMHWTFCKKMDGTKKARLVYDGARNRSMTTLGHTYANSVDAQVNDYFGRSQQNMD